MDKYHITIGPLAKIKHFEVVTGIQYSFGRNTDLDPLVNFPDPYEYIPQTGQALEGFRQDQASVSINEIALFFGMTVDLNKWKSLFTVLQEKIN